MHGPRTVKFIDFLYEYKETEKGLNNNYVGEIKFLRLYINIVFPWESSLVYFEDEKVFVIHDFPLSYD